jgi:hypothetical protein
MQPVRTTINMKKILLASILCFVGSISLTAQSELTTFQTKETKLEMEKQIVSISRPKMDVLSIVAQTVSPKSNLKLVRSLNTPIENAGTSLKRAGQMLYWGTIATAVGQLLVIAGEPVSGGVLSFGGTMVVFFAYQNITKAGRQLEQSANN